MDPSSTDGKATLAGTRRFREGETVVGATEPSTSPPKKPRTESGAVAMEQALATSATAPPPSPDTSVSAFENGAPTPPGSHASSGGGGAAPSALPKGVLVKVSDVDNYAPMTDDVSEVMKMNCSQVLEKLAGSLVFRVSMGNAILNGSSVDVVPLRPGAEEPSAADEALDKVFTVKHLNTVGDVAAKSGCLGGAPLFLRVRLLRAAPLVPSSAAPASLAVAAAGLVSASVLSSMHRPTLEAIASATASVAFIVADDMQFSRSLDQQRAATGLGELLRRPWPVSRLEAAGGEVPALAAEFLPYIGDYDAYRAAKATVSTGQVQQRHVVAVVQASGSGKTRLAYADGMESRLVVMARVWKQVQTFTPAWKGFFRLAHHWEGLLPRLSLDDRLEVAQAAVAAIRLLAASHVSFVASILQQLSATIDLSADIDSSERNALLREAALRCLRNGRGDEVVGDIFLHELHKVAIAAQFSDTNAVGSASPSINTVLLNRSAVHDFCLATDERLRALLWPEAEVALWWDEAHALFGKAKLFFPLTAFLEKRSVALKEMQDGFYGLTAVAGDLVDSYKWQQSLCGTCFEVATRVHLPTVSPLRGRVTSVFHASHVAVSDMVSTLDQFLELDSSTKTELLSTLSQLSGRPIFFFTHFLVLFWQALLKRRPTTRDQLREVLLEAANNGTTEAHTSLTDVISRMWTDDPVVLDVGVSSRYLCMELYAALRLNRGKVEFHAAAAEDALRHAILALPLCPTLPASRKLEATFVDLHREPMFCRVLAEIGSDKIRASRREPDNDPIFQLLAVNMSQGSLAGFQNTTSVKGNVLELAFVWHVIRSVDLRAPGGQAAGIPLSDVLTDLLAPDVELPAVASRVRVVVSSGIPGMHVTGPTHLHYLCQEGAQDSVLFAIERDAGVDVAFACIEPNGDPGPAVLVQAKAKKDAALSDCLRTASPAWQFMETADRRAALAGRSFLPSAERTAFEALVATPTGLQRFPRAFRVALSVTGYRSESVALCNDLNSRYNGSHDSPIILCQPTEAAFGSRLTTHLAQTCAGGALTSHTSELAFLLPQQIDQVTAGHVKRRLDEHEV